MIYFVRAATTGLVKVGFTTVTIHSRVAQMQTGCPYDLEAEHVVDVPGASLDAEVELHELLRRKTARHVRGEWYWLTREEAQALAAWVMEWLTGWSCTKASGFPRLAGRGQ